MGEFDSKVVVVTGGSRGIGRAIAAAFAREGAQTVLAASSAQNLAAVTKAIAEGSGSRVLEPVTVAADLRQLAGCEAVAAVVREHCKRCDILVNNAGATQAGNFLNLPDSAWIDGYALKLFGCVRMTRLLWPMLKEAQGHVVNIIGSAARTPGSDFLIGGSVNAAMANFSKGLAQLGKRDGVNVNVIHPGATDTERTNELLAQRAAASGRPVEELRREMLARDGLRRLGHPDDIAALALFLCAERARHIQGTAIAVDGGATPGLY
jgi:NAD(P)-dependent dehydrogenase (short-subunit alcohol dehydrogenase family)